jgi:hypothetical protein
MRESIADLLMETDAQVKAQAAKMQLVRMQMVALEQVAAGLNAGAQRTEDSARRPQFGMRDFLQFLFLRNQ